MVKNILVGAAALAFASSSMANAATRPAQSTPQASASPVAVASVLPARSAHADVKKKNELAGPALIAVLAGAAVIGGVIAIADDDDDDDSPN